MLDDLFAADNAAAARDLIARPLPAAPKPAKFSAWSAIPRGIAVAAGEVGASLSDLAGAAIALRDTPSKQMERGGLPTAAFSSELGDSVRDYWRTLKPDPETASTAEQVLFGFSRGLTKLIPATIAAGPAGAIAAGVEEAMTVSDDLRRQGVPDGPRQIAGIIQGVGMGSAALPLLGRTLAETAALYVAGGPGGFMAQQALTRKVLENAGQEKIAGNYDPFDPIGLTVASAIPLVFTAAGLRGQKLRAEAKAQADFIAGPRPSEPTPVAAAVAEAVRAPELSPEVVDAAMVNNLRTFGTAQVPAAVAHAEAWRGPVTENPNFKAWFGESKVVDAEGNPLVVYHGTGRPGFDSFDPATRGDMTGGADARAGFFFTDNPSAADEFTWNSGNKEGAIYPVYLGLKNPAVVRDMTLDGSNGTAAGRLIEQARSAGHDGVIFESSNFLGKQGRSYVVFDPQQIKSAIGNSGLFDPNSASLTDPVPRAAATEAAPPKPAAEAGDPIAKLNEPADAKPKPAADPIMSTVAMRVADLETTAPDMVVRIADDGKHVTLADDLAEVRRMVAEGTDDSLGTLDADLMRVAVECALSTGG